ncbi:MAG: EAL domain-containing protein [Sphingomonas sp.]|nr:EAL domain-containing protein [Sphingomonas sp.]
MVRAEQFGLGLHGVGNRRRALFISAASPVPVFALPDIGLGGLDQLQFDAGFGRFAGTPVGAPFADDTGGGPLIVLPWRFLALVEISNFAPLRRHLGAPRADCLVLDVADRVATRLADARLAVVGRTTIEIAFEGDEPVQLHDAIATITTLFATPIDLDGEPHMVEIAIGAVVAETSVADDVRLIEEAEEALGQARIEQRPVVRDLSVGTPGFDRFSLVRDLGKALARHEMFLQYQPKVHLRQQKIASIEALVRWHHPVRGLILPGDFIPAAEEARIIGPLTLWTIEQVISDQRLLAQQGHDLPIFVNISGQLLADTAFVARACQMVQQSDAKIGFEITETSVIRDPETAIAHLQIFAEMGITIAIDDYGAGLSSLAYLKQLPAKELKIDKMFVLQLTSSNRDPLIVRSTIDLAHALDMEVTAEGVETQAAMALLSVMGCDMVQGFLISRPLSIGALKHFLDEEKHLAVAADPRAAFNRPASFWKSAS